MRWQRMVPLVVLGAIFLGALAVAQQSGDAEDRAIRMFQELNSTPYTDWAFEPGVPAGYYVGVEPHGMILRTFINDIAQQDAEGDGNAFSDGAIIVKENHMPGEGDLEGLAQQEAVEGFEGNLAALTFMVKDQGYNPGAGDWFWAKVAADGTVDAAGTPDGCIACHSQVEDQDYVFNFAPGSD